MTWKLLALLAAALALAIELTIVYGCGYTGAYSGNGPLGCCSWDPSGRCVHWAEGCR